MPVYRYAEKFENLAGSLSYTFPIKGGEAQFEQSLRVPTSIAFAADYAHDHLGYGVSAKDPGTIRIRALIVQATAALMETEVDNARSICQRIGKGYLYRLNQDGTRHRCLARLRSMPSFTRGGGNVNFQPISFDFLQLSDWMATAAVTGTQTIDTALEQVTLNNTGNQPCPVLFRLRNNGYTRADLPALLNSTTGEYMTFLRAMNQPDHELYVDTSTGLVQFSTNDGASYANDYSNFAGSLSWLAVGNNVFVTMAGRSHPLPFLSSIEVPNFDLSWSYTPRFV